MSFDPKQLIELLYSNSSINNDNYKNLFYTYTEKDVTGHLFKVVTGLDSLVLGEYQIQGQVKEAYSKACDAKTVDKILHKLFHAAFRTGKRVRANTSLGDGKQSVSGVASQIMIDNLIKTDRIAIIGVNETTKILATELNTAGFNNLVFVNRTNYKADMLAEQYCGLSAGLDEIENVLFDCQAIFSSTGAPGIIVSSELLQKLFDQNHCPRLIIDMAVPRDIDTKGLDQEVRSIDMNDLKNYLDLQKKNQLEAIPEVNKIIEDEIKVFQAWSETRTNTMLEPYSEKFEIIRQQLLEEYKQQFSHIAFDKVDKLSRSLVHRMQSTFVRALIRTNQEIKVIKQHRDSL